ncbi:MAG: septal ring lytic transglycosylase RlpA family protein [Steroidobacteraceae bacterium]
MLRTPNSKLLTLVCSLLLGGCFTTTPPPQTIPAPPSPTPTTPTTPTPSTTKSLAELLAMPDAVPRIEQLSKRGNPAFYEVLGKRYFVMSSAAGYVERGVASWYGPGFHEEFTSNGEPYDMYGMTAAHKTLPLPSFVQVTNLANGKSVVLRVNDRGPFKEGRIINLSYTAAAKLDTLRAGTALVEVRAITPGQGPLNASATIKTLYVQAGAFSTVGNADKLAAQLRGSGYAQAFVRSDMVDGRTLYRVRIGPIADVANFDRVVAELKKLGVADARLALD